MIDDHSEKIERHVFGRVPCAAWEFVSLGSAGGPASMKGRCAHGDNGCFPEQRTLPWPDYHKSADAVLQVVEAMTKKGFYFSAQNCQTPKRWRATFSDGEGVASHDGSFCDAVCYAALTAVRAR